MGSTRIDEVNVEVPGGRVYVKKWTPENQISSSPLILLHDSLGCVDLWRDFPLLLAESLSRCVIAYDRLGFGKSSARDRLPPLQFIEQEASQYFPLLKKQLSLESYILLGYSVGGGMAINIAARDPDCKAVVTLSAQAFVEDLTVTGIMEAQRRFRQPGQMQRLAKWHGDKAEWVLHAWTDIWLSPDFSGWSLQPCIGRVVCPVLAIHGEQDEYGSLAFPEFIANNTGGDTKMLVLKGCGHMPHKEKTSDVVVAVKAWFQAC